MPSIPEYPVTSTSNFRNTNIYWLQKIASGVGAGPESNYALEAGGNLAAILASLSTGVKTSVQAATTPTVAAFSSITSAALAAADPTRKGLSIQLAPGETKSLFVLKGAGTASNASGGYSFIVNSSQPYYESTPADAGLAYTAIWSGTPSTTYGCNVTLTV